MVLSQVHDQARGPVSTIGTLSAVIQQLPSRQGHQQDIDHGRRPLAGMVVSEVSSAVFIELPARPAGFLCNG